MKKILGLDLGTNSIGWAVVNAEVISRDNETTFLKPNDISASGSRIIPMDAAILGDFDRGNSISQTAERTGYRGVRRLRERNILRRDRLHRILKILDFLPPHYSEEIDCHGHFINNAEPKLAWRKNESGKMEFIFMDSFYEMLEEFRRTQPQIVSEGKMIPLDWTIYYLRKKALTRKITKEEIAWILLNFNQKRGYYQLRGEEEDEKADQLVEYRSLKVISVEDSGEKKGKDTWYNVLLENGWIYRRPSSVYLDWVGKTKDFIVSTALNDDGTPKIDKEGQVRRSFRAPKEDDWTLLKKKTEAEIEQSQKTIGAFIFDAILQKPTQKIRGRLVRTVERKYYRQELQKILDKQLEFHEEFKDKVLYEKCIKELYPNNEEHRRAIGNKGFAHLFINDIIFYQRPLKSKKSLIDDCPYESRFDKEGNEHPIKCIAKSHPLFQEFRLWQFVQNLRIYQRERIEVDGQLDIWGNPSSGKLQTDVDVTQEFLKSEDDVVALFDWLNNRKEIEQNVLLKSYFKIKKPKGKYSEYPYRWNYVEDKSYPCNETRANILSRLEKAEISPDFLTREVEAALWHILYSVEDKQELVKALGSFAQKHRLERTFVDIFAQFPPFKKDYGSYSAKAIKKLLPLMRMGKYWDAEAIDSGSKERIDKIISGEYDERIRDRVREKAFNLTDISHFKGLPVWLACYVVYDRHSEVKDVSKWEKPEDIDNYLKAFKQHSLRNPIVEQVITETLRTVRDIWKQEGQIDEIHIELGREMRNPADKRKKMTEQSLKNETTNLRIKAMLMEFAEYKGEDKIEDVRPYSPMQQYILRIYEDYALSNINQEDKDFDFVERIQKQAQPSKSDILRYKCWLEQKYRSPYTGAMIPLSKLFTPAYEIEHIIPQSRYFDDSFVNKVICESEVNKLKDNSLGYEFIKKHPGEKIQIGQNKTVSILTVEEYERFVKDHYSRNRNKMRRLLMEDIPDEFISRQLNDSRYISKFIKGLLSNIVRDEDEQEAISRNVITCTGSVTDRLKKDWGVNDKWNEIILPRFRRLNELTGSASFVSYNTEGHEIPDLPYDLQSGFNKKRIDHRHHAMDAIVIACATRKHIQYLNNENAKSSNRALQAGLAKQLCLFKEVEFHKKVKNDAGLWSDSVELIKRTVPDKIMKPWDTFTSDVRNELEGIVVSFKQNLRVINKTVNHYQHYDENGNKELLKQEKGDSWAIRKPMHKDTVFGEINLRKIKTVSLKEALDNTKRIVNKDLKSKLIELLKAGYSEKQLKAYFEGEQDVWSDVNLKKIEVYYFTQEEKDKAGNVKERYFASRKPLDISFDEKKIRDSVSDTGIQSILLAHLKSKNDDPNVAFSPDGIDEMNKNIIHLNKGKFHHPVYKVRVYEKADKFSIGHSGNKIKKYVEAAKGTNLFFAVYKTENVDKKTGEIVIGRSYDSIPLNQVIERQKQKLLPVPETNEIGDKLLFWLSPNDLVYLPTEEEVRNKKFNVPLNKQRIYKMVSTSGNQCFFISSNIATSIVNKVEFGSLNKMERAITGEMIKETCIPIKVDRLGNVIEIQENKL